MMRGGIGVTNPSPEMAGVGGRVPQWGQQETRELIAIRGEMERGEKGKSNKTMWEEVAARMRERGYIRTPDQCKCKWKNLVNRYKGKETTDPDNTKHCPFFEELHSVFNERAKTMHRKLLEGSENPAKKKGKRLRNDDVSDDVVYDEDDVDDDISDEDTKPAVSKRTKQQTASTSGRLSGGIQEVLQNFLNQQQVLDNEWREILERRVRERMVFEQGWREKMERLERERLMLERDWMEREERRREREESRSEKRERVLNAILNKLLEDDDGL